MRHRHSDIFDAYEKLALEKGLIKNADEKESKELKKYKSDPKARNGSDDISTIEALYGVKPNPEDEKKYRNIIDRAHPNAVIIAPSYDKLNGLVENENERADIIRNIIMNRPLPSGSTINTKYAHDELVMELVRVATDLDNSNEEELRMLADECLDELAKKADIMSWIKEKLDDAGSVAPGVAGGAGIGLVAGALLAAFTGAAVLPIVGVGAVAGGVIAAIAKTGPQVKNIEENAKDVKEQLADLRSKLPAQEEFFNKIDEALVALIGDTNRYQNLIDGFKIKDLDAEQKTPVNPQDASVLAKNFAARGIMIKKLQIEFDRRAKSGEFAKAAPSKALSPLYMFISDDVEDVQEAFVSLGRAIDNLKSTMGGIYTEVAAQNPSADSASHPAVPGRNDLPEAKPEAAPSAPKQENSGMGFKDLMNLVRGI